MKCVFNVRLLCRPRHVHLNSPSQHQPRIDYEVRALAEAVYGLGARVEVDAA